MLKQRDRGAAAGDARLVVLRLGLDVHVQPGNAVGGDHRLVGLGDLADAGAGVGDLGAALVGAVAAEGRDHITAGRAQRRSARRTARPAGRAGLGAVPGQRAGALLRGSAGRPASGSGIRTAGPPRDAVGGPGLEVGRVQEGPAAAGAGGWCRRWRPAPRTRARRPGPSLPSSVPVAAVADDGAVPGERAVSAGGGFSGGGFSCDLPSVGASGASGVSGRAGSGREGRSCEYQRARYWRRMSRMVLRVSTRASVAANSRPCRRRRAGAGPGPRACGGSGPGGPIRRSDSASCAPACRTMPPSRSSGAGVGRGGGLGGRGGGLEGRPGSLGSWPG